MVTAVRCDDTCRKIVVDWKTVSIVKTCDHSPPRLFADEPDTIRARVIGPTHTADDPLGAITVASFKTQCQQCLDIFGGWWKTSEPIVEPVESYVRAQGRDYLVSRRFLTKPDGLICPVCWSDAQPSDIADMRISEGDVPSALPGWLVWPMRRG